MLHNAPKSPPGKASSEVWMEGFVTLALFVTEKENELEITVKKKTYFFLIFFLRTPWGSLLQRKFHWLITANTSKSSKE